MEIAYYIDIKYACFGMIVKDGIVKHVPAIAGWMRGKALRDIKYWLGKRRAIIERIN